MSFSRIISLGFFPENIHKVKNFNGVSRAILTSFFYLFLLSDSKKHFEKFSYVTKVLPSIEIVITEIVITKHIYIFIRVLKGGSNMSLPIHK